MVEVISVKRLIRVFEGIQQTKSETQACFILGAGASRSSGIRTGAELARLWFQELKEDYSEEDFEVLLQQHGILRESPDEFYNKLYALRYRDAPWLGYDFINKEMENVQPSFGYTVLAQILSTTQHNIVISTNFDNLVELSLYTYTDVLPLICAHESLAQYARPSVKRPLIAKIHRGKEYGPNSAPREVEELVNEWVRPLKDILNNRIIVCIGYGGNDGSLMGFLEKIIEEKNERVVDFYWCVKGKELPNLRVQQLLKRSGGKIVETGGFDELMLELGDKLGLGLIDQQIEDIGKRRAMVYRRKIEEMKGRYDNAKDPDRKKAADNMTNKAQSNWWQYVLQAKDASTNDEKERILKEAITEYPNNPDVVFSYADFLQDAGRFDEAENHFLRSIELNPYDPTLYNNYALFLDRHRKDFDAADKYFLKALELAPNDAVVNGNYASFLGRNNRNDDKAALYFIKSLEIFPDDPTFNNNYGHLLDVRKRQYDEAEKYYRKSHDQDPTDTVVMSNLGGLLYKQKQFEEADKLIDFIIEEDIPDNILLKSWFLKYIYHPDVADEARAKIKSLLKKSNRVMYYDFDDHLENARKNHHPQLDELKGLDKKMKEPV
ncbi:MAG TPA: tetratricopeptide repeat protein [Chitinophagaceae bacterium]|nr:tetratricopeptide repeat protein [Chitinophagaceae bacterium]